MNDGQAGANALRVMEQRYCCSCHKTFLILASSPRSMNFIQCAPCTEKQLRLQIRAGKRKRIRVGWVVAGQFRSCGTWQPEPPGEDLKSGTVLN